MLSLSRSGAFAHALRGHVSQVVGKELPETGNIIYRPPILTTTLSQVPNVKTPITSGNIAYVSGISGGTQFRFAHTDIPPIGEDNHRILHPEYVDPKSDTRATAARHTMFQYAVSGTIGVFGAYVAKNTFLKGVGYFDKSADLVATANIEVDLNDIPEGTSLMVKWRGKPLWVRHRTKEESDKAVRTDMRLLKDPQLDTDRTKRPDWLVCLGICTHLGCVPLTHQGDYNGFFCPCHGSHYDTSGRIRSGPAPTNLEVPAHFFPKDDRLFVGLDTPAATG